ncbi:DUF3306 domain-containing protein [Paeniroseomonas aquatica]|uniref:DUF3306 domain-containing protein n=1 Tax=Paeniroseomonas aquatica TaxID=373043 RepID=A0ABT8A8J1_9PROT|nr:DUF3306 domain-containing protein [Paeniroseomonas aquatica]MDN3566117.1 DUF3306 domain-containing protein [Paeniroseomonas aquatica]
MTVREEGFLSRWSRRKRGVLPEPEAPPPAPGAEPAAEAAPGLPAAPPAEAFDPAGLPPVESLTGASDFTAFLRPGVPAPLRQAALRRAWTLDPAIRDFIGPADYAWDYNAPDGVPGFALQLGGDVTRMLAQAIGALEKLAPPEEAPPVALAEVAVPPDPDAPDLEEAAAPASGAGPDPAMPPAQAPALALVVEGVAAAPPLPPPRRHGRAKPV